jgi:hypothetical protein
MIMRLLPITTMRRSFVTINPSGGDVGLITAAFQGLDD